MMNMAGAGVATWWLWNAAAVSLMLCYGVQSNSVIQLVYRVEEDCRLGTVLADIKTDSGLSQRYASTPADREPPAQ